MKLTLITISTVMFMLVGCVDNTPSPNPSPPPTYPQTQPADNGQVYTIIHMGGCEYIVSNYSLTHKGNCTNNIHNYRKITVVIEDPESITNKITSTNKNEIKN